MNALLSVSDKTGIVEFAQGLHALGAQMDRIPAAIDAGATSAEFGEPAGMTV